MGIDVELTRARPEDSDTLTTVAFAAKRHWGYPERWLEHWREALTVSPEFIARHETYVAMREERAVGFCALRPKGQRMELVHLWVLPDAMGRGGGRALFLHALERARALGYSELEIESDPNAEGFYLRLGARRVGIKVTELEDRRRELPILVMS